MGRTNKLVTIEQYRLLLSGVSDTLSSKVPIVLLGESLTPKEIAARIQARIDLAAETTDAKTAYHKAVQAETTADGNVSDLRDALQTYLQSLYGKKSAELKTFGFEPAKPRKVSAATAANSVLKASKTREENGTMGAKQRKEAKAARDAAAASTATVPTAPVVQPAASAPADPAPPPATPTATNGTAPHAPSYTTK